MLGGGGTDRTVNLCDRISTEVANFSSYSDEVELLYSHVPDLDELDLQKAPFEGILNGKASLALKRLIAAEIRREAGLFFTNEAIAEKVVAYIAPMLRTGCKVVDPACGAGNLLLACAQHLPIGQNLNETMLLWSKLISGCDIHSEFVRAARTRLALLALTFHSNEKVLAKSFQPDQVFIGLKTGSAFDLPAIDHDTCVVVNPPFGHAQAPADCGWAAGKVQVAALFLERFIHRLPEKLHVVAILPEVLRSGTRYKKWRDVVASNCSSIEIELAGRFDNCTDVDIFIMHAVVGRNVAEQHGWPAPDLPVTQHDHVLSDFFKISVGSVVPHRHVAKGSFYPYIHARTATPWEIIELIHEQRAFEGGVFDPPFVVVHRTSSPSDKHRCVATVVNEKRPIAVENHLIVLQPHDKCFESCEEALKLLKSPLTDEWINRRIRCRHLTVTALRELPCPKLRALTDVSNGNRKRLNEKFANDCG